MANRFDPRNDPEVAELLGRLPATRFKPLVDAADLREIVTVFAGLPELEFPIHSSAELIEKLGGTDETFEIAEVKVNPLRMIKHMPAYYFPISSIENYIEKLAELVRANRKQIDVPKEFANIKQQLPVMRFPIANVDELLQQIGRTRRYKFEGREVDAERMAKRIPPTAFPIKSEDDFYTTITRLMWTRPLIVKD